MKRIVPLESIDLVDDDGDEFSITRSGQFVVIERKELGGSVTIYAKDAYTFTEAILEAARG